MGAAPAESSAPSGTPDPSTDSAPPEFPIWKFTLRNGGDYTFESDLQDVGGSVSVGRAALGVNVAATISARTQLILDVGGEYSRYSFDTAFSGTTNLAPGGSVALSSIPEPVEDTYQVIFRPEVRHQLQGPWSVYGGGLFTIAGEDDADVGDSFTAGGYGGVGYTFSENFTLRGGLAVRQRLEDDPLVVPLFGFDWKVNDRVTVRSTGLMVEARAQMLTEVAFTLGGGWDFREFRLADDHPIPDGILRDNRVEVTAGVEWTPLEWMMIGVKGGALVWQEFKLLDNEAESEFEFNSDPAAVLGMYGTITF